MKMTTLIFTHPGNCVQLFALLSMAMLPKDCLVNRVSQIPKWTAVDWPKEKTRDDATVIATTRTELGKGYDFRWFRVYIVPVINCPASLTKNHSRYFWWTSAAIS